MRENPIELFKENADIETNHLQAALKCRGFVDEFFPNNFGGKRIHAGHRKYVNGENLKFFHGF